MIRVDMRAYVRHTCPCNLPYVGTKVLVVGHHLTWYTMGRLHYGDRSRHEWDKYAIFISPRPHQYYTKSPEAPLRQAWRGHSVMCGARRWSALVEWARNRHAGTRGWRGLPWNSWPWCGGSGACYCSSNSPWVGWCLSPPETQGYPPPPQSEGARADIH